MELVRAVRDAVAHLIPVSVIRLQLLTLFLGKTLLFLLNARSGPFLRTGFALALLREALFHFPFGLLPQIAVWSATHLLPSLDVVSAYWRARSPHASIGENFSAKTMK